MRHYRAAIAVLLLAPLACAWWPPEIDAKCPTASRGYDLGLTMVRSQPEGCEFLGEVAAESGRISSHWWSARNSNTDCAQALISERALALGANTLFLEQFVETIPVDSGFGSVLHLRAAAYLCRT